MPADAPSPLRYRSPAGRWALAATVLGSSMAFLDATVVNIALPAISRDLGGGLAGLQWTVNAYALTLAGLLLLGGALGDRLGRRRIFAIGAAWFAAASLACGLAPGLAWLIGARALQGVGAALLTPGSLAIIQAAFHQDDRGAAIGAWSGLTGIAAALGPFLGGQLIEASWRWIFLINLPVAAAVLAISARHVPESLDPAAAARRLDVEGGLIAAAGLAGLTWGLTEGGPAGWASPAVVASLTGGAAVLAGFVLVERRRRAAALVPVDMFAVRRFSATNAVTLLVYGALSGAFFLIPVELQEASRYSPLRAGAALAPVTAVMLVLSPRAGTLSNRIGPRLPMSAGPVVAGAGLALLTRVGPHAPYATVVLPGVLVFGLGLSLTVAPLTATVLAAGGAARTGVSSAVNNAVARTAGLIAVAVIPVAAGLAAPGTVGAAAFSDGYRRGMWLSAGLCAAGGLLAALTIGAEPAGADVTTES